MPTLSEKEMEKITADMDERTRRDLKGSPHLDFYLTGTLDSVREFYAQGSTLTRFTVRYKAPSFSRKLLSLQIERQGVYPAVENFSAWRSKIVARRG